MTDDLIPGLHVGEQLSNQTNESQQAEPASELPDPTLWAARVRDALEEGSDTALDIAEDAVRACPGEFELLLLAALRHQKRYVPSKAVSLLTALAYGQQRQFSRAWTILCAEGIESFPAAIRWFVGAGIMLHWLRERLVEIRLEQGRTEPHRAKTRSIRPNPLAKPAASRPQRASVALAAPITAAPDLTRQDASFNVEVEIVNTQAIVLDGAEMDRRWFRLRSELNRLSLFEGFDELLCLPALRGVEIHWHQVETVRKVLKQYRGRVLLADEVGLGKTIEAGMVLKEYALRGMAERILILAPAALVGQWRDEMQSKFGIDCATSHDALLRTDSA